MRRTTPLLSYSPGWGTAALATLGAAALGILAGLRLAALRDSVPSDLDAARASRARRVDDHLANATRTDAGIAHSQLRRDERARADREEAEEEIGLLEATLREVRDAAGADEAIFWRWVESRDSLAPAAWSTVGVPRPAFFRFDEWAPLAQWSAQTQLIQHDGAIDLVRFAAAPVTRGTRLLGVLTLSRETGLELPPGDDHEWLARHARQLAALLDLCEVRRDYGRHLRHSRALLEVVGQIHAHRSPEALARAICDTAVDVTSARHAALVRWGAELGTGELQHATAGFGVGASFPVSERSIVATACRERLTLVQEDASARHPSAVVFAESERLAELGSLAVVPLFHDEAPIGALVVASPEVGTLGHEEGQFLSLLGALAAPPLVRVWEIEEVSRRAFTDALTGLANRRFFDDHFERALAEADRYGTSVALVLVDIDHFKKVNDTHGHDAGDAVLRAVARTLQDGARAADVCARFGGEEMAIVLPQTDREGAAELAERLRQAIGSRVVRHGSEEIRVTASFGVATYPGCARSRDALFPAADKALYEAKRDGRDRVRCAQLIARPARV